MLQVSVLKKNLKPKRWVIKINKNSVVGAGSVITRNISKKSLALTRSQQLEIKNYKRKS